MAELSSRERMLQAITCREPDHVPCSFMIFSALEEKCRDPFEFVEKQIELGLDAFVQVPAHRPEPSEQALPTDLCGPPVRHDRRVREREWREDRQGQRYPVLCKEYETPAGALRVEVLKSDDWPYGDRVPFLNDYLIPRSLKFMVERPRDLDALEYLLIPTPKEDIEAFRQRATRAREFAGRHGLLVAGGWGVGADMAGWLCGLQNLIYMAADEPELLRALMAMIADWNRERMELILDVGVDLFARRGWYETTDFWSPSLYRQYILPTLKAEVELAHGAGAKFGYISTTAHMPLLDLFAESQMDVLIGVDPVQGRGTDMAVMKQKLAGRIALWGGVNGFVTMETGGTRDVRRAVEQAMRTLAPGGGFILSPVDNVRDTSAHTWQNVLTLIETWRKLR